MTAAERHCRLKSPGQAGKVGPSMIPRLIASFLAVALAARADESAIIAKARAYIGPESVLEGVTSVHFVGKLTSPDPAAPGDTSRIVSAKVDIVFQKPWQQWLTIDNGQIVRTFGLDDFDVWQKIADAKNPGRFRVSVLPLDMIRRIRADVWQNLYYFRGVEDVGGTVQDQGPVTIDGIACEKLLFTHPIGITYIRCFEQSTGRLVFTETDGGMKVRQEGEILAGGLRFPQRLVQKRTGAGGKEETSIYTFEKITVNEKFPDSLFQMPNPVPLAPAPPGASAPSPASAPAK